MHYRDNKKMIRFNGEINPEWKPFHQTTPNILINHRPGSGMSPHPSNGLFDLYDKTPGNKRTD